jgi:hypothetical protein
MTITAPDAGCKELLMVNNKFSGVLITTDASILDAIEKEDLGICGTREGAVLLWSHELESDASEGLANTLTARHPELFSYDDGELHFTDAEDTMLYFLH